MGRSYLRYVSALLVLLALVLPMAATTVHAGQVSVTGGRGVVFTSTVGVGGQVEFFFNLTGQTWVGPTGYIYLSSNGNDYVTMGDTQISQPFTATTSSVEVQYIVGNITITVQDVENFIQKLESASVYYSSQNPDAGSVLQHLREYGWALVYLKFSTSTPSPTYTGQAIAAGPFNLTLKPAFAVRPYKSNYMSTYNCTVNNNKYGIHSVEIQSVNLTGLSTSITSYISSHERNYTILAYYESPLTGLTSQPVLVYEANYGKQSGTWANTSRVFYNVPATKLHGYNLTILSANLSASFAPPVLTAVPGTYLNGFNMSVWAFDEYNYTITVPAPTITHGVTVVFNGGSVPYTTSGAVVSTNLTLSVTNVNATGLVSSAKASFLGWLDVLPSFNFTSMNEMVAGPTNQLNPGDIVNVTFANMPEDSMLTSVQAVGNESLLSTEPIAVFEWNENKLTKLENFFLTGNMTNATSPITGVSSHGYSIVIPNAPYGLPFSYLGLYLGFSYTAQLANGSTPGFTSAVYGSAGPYCNSTLAVYPFMQVFTSNIGGQFLYNTTLLLGNYLLVRGFGFPAGSYSDLTLTYGTYSAAVTPLSGTLETDQYGDFVYITQVPYTGPFASAITSMGPSTTGYPITISAEVGLNGTSYSVLVPPGLGDALIYVQPTPTTWDNTTPTLALNETLTYALTQAGITSLPVPTSSLSAVTFLPNIYGMIVMPPYLIRFPYEATEYIVNGTKALIPSWEGGIEDVVIVGAPLSSPRNLTLLFYLQINTTQYYNSVNLSALQASDYEVKFTNGYAEISYLPVPDLFGNVMLFNATATMLYYAQFYTLWLHNVHNNQYSQMAFTEFYVATAAEVLIEPGNFDVATMIVNYTSSSNPLGLPSLYMNVTIQYTVGPWNNAKFNSTEFIYEWPPYATGEVPYLLLLPGTELKYYLFGSPWYTLAYPNVAVVASCGGNLNYAYVGQLINGTLFTVSPSGQFKGGVLNPAQYLCAGTWYLSFPYFWYWEAPPVYMEGWYGVTTPLSISPALGLNVSVYYVASLPAEPVAVSAVGSGSTVNAGEPYVVLVSSQLPILGLEPSVARYFFAVGAPSLQAYVLGHGGALVAVPSANIKMVGAMDGFYVYEITVPSNVTYGQLVVVASGTATYVFTGETFTGTAAAEMGIVPTTNSTAIEQAVSQALAQFERTILTNVTGQLNTLESQVESVNSTLAHYYGELSSGISGLSTSLTNVLSGLQQLSQQIAAAQHSLAYGIVGNATSIEQSLSTVAAGQQALASELHSLSGYMAGNFSETLAYLSDINSTLSQATAYLPELAKIAEQVQSINGYMAGNFSAISSALGNINASIYHNFGAINATLQGIQGEISTLEGDVTAVGSEVGTVGANVLTLLHDAQTLSGYAEATLSYLSSMNSTLTGVSSSLSSLSSMQATLSSMSSKLDSISSTLSSVSSGVTSVQGTLSSMSSTLSSVSSGVSSMQNTLSSMSSTLSSVSSTLSGVSTTASNAYTESQHVASVASTAATYALAALVVAIIALALIAYVAFAKF